MLSGLAESGMAPQHDEVVPLLQQAGEMWVLLVFLSGKGIFGVPVHPATLDVTGHDAPATLLMVVGMAPSVVIPANDLMEHWSV